MTAGTVDFIVKLFTNNITTVYALVGNGHGKNKWLLLIIWINVLEHKLQIIF